MAWGRIRRKREANFQLGCAELTARPLSFSVQSDRCVSRIGPFSSPQIPGKFDDCVIMWDRPRLGLSNAFGKKLENFCAAVAVNVSYYNFCKRHIAVEMTPAQAGVDDHQWAVAELVERCDE